MLNSKADGSVTIDTTIDTEGLTKAIDKMNQAVEGFVKKTTSSIDSIDKSVDGITESAQKNLRKLKIEPNKMGIQRAIEEFSRLEKEIEIQEDALRRYEVKIDNVQKGISRMDPEGFDKLRQKAIQAERTIEKLYVKQADLTQSIYDAETAMKNGAKSMADYNAEIDKAEKASKEAKEKIDEYNDSLGKTEDSGKKAEKGMSAFGHAISHFVIDITKKAVSSLIDLISKTKELRGDMSKLSQNARDSGTSMQTVDDVMRSLNAITGETDSNIEAVSNLLAAGFKDNNLQEAVDTLAGAVIKFPDTIKIESLSDSLQETLATKEATGQFAEVLGRVGINVEEYNRRISRMSESQARNYTIQQLQKKGLEEVTKDWRENNKEMIEAADAAYELQKTQAELAAVMDPIRTKILTAINKLLSENKDTIQGLIQTVGNVIQFLLRALDVVSQIPAPVLLIGTAILVVVGAIAKFSLGSIVAAKAMATVSKTMAAAAPSAATAGISFALLSLEIAGVAASIALVVAAIALLIDTIARLVSASKGVPSSIPTPSLSSETMLSGNQQRRGYAVGTVAARRGLALVGENGPELVNFRGGERVYNATQTAAMQSMAARNTGGTYQDNRQYIFKVDDIATYVTIEKRMRGEQQSRRMGYIGAY